MARARAATSLTECSVVWYSSLGQRTVGVDLGFVLQGWNGSRRLIKRARQMGASLNPTCLLPTIRQYGTGILHPGMGRSEAVGSRIERIGMPPVRSLQYEAMIPSCGNATTQGANE
jgi:hypothetical protein